MLREASVRFARCVQFAWPFAVLALFGNAIVRAADETSVATITAFAAKHCQSCHSVTSKPKPQGELAFVPVKDVTSIAQGRKHWIKIRTAVERGDMPPDDKPRPEPAEREVFLKAVATVFDQIDLSAKPDPGRVTMRRLNRTEYSATIRDLCGIDFNAAEDFPSDDVGYGFDNIADVLTLSPVLAERYLVAAENVMSRAIMPNPPKPALRALAGRWLEPSGQGSPEGRFRPISTIPSDKPFNNGPLSTSYQVPAFLNDYVFRVRAYAKSDDDKPVKMVVMLCQLPSTDGAAPDEEVNKIFGPAVERLKPFKILDTVEITARDEKSAQRVEVKIPQTPGVKRIAVGLLKPAEGETPKHLHVEWFELEGPLDSRPQSHRLLLAHDPAKTGAERSREVLSRFASRAFRRPATEDEVTRLLALAAAQEAGGASWETAMQVAMQAALVSPKFLFRIELDSQPDSPVIQQLDDFQLASRLSYFLWNTLPDQELSELARQGELSANLDAQVVRMLKDPKALTLIDNFAMQWLQLQRLKVVAPDKQRFPNFSEPLRQSMLEETRLFLKEVFLEDRSLLDLIDGKYTYLNEALARHYQIIDVNGTRAGKKPIGAPIRGRQFMRVAWDESDRGGLLTQASILTVTSNPTRTSPVKRGKFVLEQLLGTPPPPPPPNVPELEAQKDKLTGSLRQQMEQHRQNPACANCHDKMDALGFAFENFDGIGAFRAKDGEFDIDPAGTLPSGQSFKGPTELKTILKGQAAEVTRCLTEKLMTYGLGRGIDYYDRPVVERIVKTLPEKNYRFAALITEIVKSEPFRMRRGE